MKRLTIYIDGNCPMCVAGAIRLRNWDKLDALKFVNAHETRRQDEVRARFGDANRPDEMRVALPDGSWRTGYFAWAAILANLPRLKWLGKAMALPLFYGIGPQIYKWVAARRLTISRLLRLPPPCDENGVCRLPKT